MTATVTDPAGGNLTGGGVTFTLYPSGTVAPASALDVCVGVTVTGNVATCTYTPTNADAGTYTVRAEYGGDQQYGSSASAAASLTVTAIATVTTLNSVSPAAADPGQTVTLTATVTDQAGDSLTGGTVTFFWSPAPVDGVSAAGSVDICLHSPLTYNPAAHDNVATCQYTIPSGMGAGTLEMQAAYTDPAGAFPESGSGTVAFTVG
jgi:Bacterial Ig-like domain (group 3)